LFQLKVADYRKGDGRYRTEKINVPTGKMKQDILPHAPCRTMVKRAKDSETAKRWGSRFGTVIACNKVDISHYHRNVEHLNLGRTIQIDAGYTLDKSLRITRPRRDIPLRVQPIDMS
jgi:hypothetical protein